VFEAGGVITEYAGGYDDWIRQRPRPADKKEPVAGRQPVKRREKKDQPRKLTFREGKELEALPGRIEKFEQEQNGLYEQMATPVFYTSPGERISRAKARGEELSQELEGAYRRWLELESIREANS